VFYAAIVRLIVMRADFNAIARILTLRYDPIQKPVRKRLTPLDFTPQDPNGDDIVAVTHELIRKELLKKHAELKFRRVSLALSGGVDSGLSLSMLRTMFPDVKIDCVCVGFGDEDDEIRQAEKVAGIFDCNFSGIIVDNVLSELPKLISIVKEPRWNLYQYYALDHGKKGSSDVFYTGDGGDELFGGYTFRYQKFLSSLPGRTGWKDKVKLYLSCHERDWVPDQNKMFGPAVKFSWEKIYQLFKPFFSNRLAPLNQVFLADFNGKLLYDWLPTNVAFADFLKIKIESIFLTDAMIKFATHVPWEEKYDPGRHIGKMPLRSILAMQKGNQKISGDMVKKGFSLNLNSMWKRDGKEIVLAMLNKDSEIVRKGIISERWLSNTLTTLQDRSEELRSRYISKMLSLLALEVWYRLFISRTLNSRQRL
jgi:asparagine synthase (glutamine-hydrolysing)